ncbi:MAG TPA: hypothetical protein VMG35_24510 [Bryobacteraceae bacterium]|nr:hypothetical protein [Bryobacteraceae bacterium]
MARRIAREEALFAGTSSGANVIAAIQVAERLGPGAQDGRLGRLDRHDPDTRFVPLQHRGDPAQRGRRPDAVHESVDFALRLTPDLLSERVVALDAVVIVELVGPVSVRLFAQLTGGLDHVLDQFSGGEASFAWDERQFGAKRCHVIPFLLAECVGADDP